jgi:putative heme-binding domain-containing protein
MMTKLLTVPLLSLLAAGAIQASGVEGITLSDPTLKAELIDTHPADFFLSHDMDLQGRLYLGCREAVYSYERTTDGGFQKRKELFRYPKNTWVYDLEAFGNDLLILTNIGLYRLRNVGEADSKLEKILWGNPLGHPHQGMHGIEFAPDGDLLIVMGDPHPGLLMDKTRPDHLWMWTWYVGPKNRPVPYTGVGAVMRLDLDTYDFSVYASGLRNACGLSFDRDWNLFVNDNDQEATTATPGRLVHVMEHSWNGWARGWDSTQSPARRDMTPNVNWAIDVPVGQGYYDHTALGDNYRGSLFVANWGSRSVSHHPIRPKGAGFRAESMPFLLGDGLRRPVSVMPTNDGRLIVALCYMKSNAPSPVCQTDLLLISPRKATPNAAFDHSKRPLLELLSEPIQLRSKAHREVLRQGGGALEEAAAAFADTAADAPAFSSLIFLAAAHGDSASIKRITALLTQGKGRVGSLAWRAAAAHPEKFSALTGKDISTAAAKTNDPRLLAGLLQFLHAAKRPIPDSVATLAAHRDPVVRQSAAILLGRHAANDQLAALAQGTATEQRASTLATAFRLWQHAQEIRELPEGGQVGSDKHMRLLHPDGLIDLHDFDAPVGAYRMAGWWRNAAVRDAHQAEFQRLEKALSSADKAVAIAAATGLFFLNDERVDATVISVLGDNEITLSIAAGKASKQDRTKALLALKGAKLPTGTEIPEAFRKIDWDGKNAPDGDPVRGKALFVERGCIACHLSPHDGTGGSIGPTLVGVGERFPASYLAASILVPNLAVSPNFHPNTVTMKDGTIHTGFSRPGNAPGVISLQLITGQALELNKKDIAKQDASEQSLMPAGLVQTPKDMAHLIAYMRAIHPKPDAKRRAPKKKGPKKAPKKKASTGTPATPPAALLSEDPSAVDVQRRIESTKANAFGFPPTEAKHVRVNVLGSSKGQPCIDELEVFSGDSPKNLALQSNGARASASSLIAGHEKKHRIEFLNDGQYGNARSWIPAEKTGWAQIELPKAMTIDRVVLSRDRNGTITGRTPISFDILISKDGKEWTTMKKVRPPTAKRAERPARQPQAAAASPGQPVTRSIPPRKAAADEAGFTAIFDGKSLDKWDHRKGAWKIVDGTISCTGVEKTRNWIIWRGGTPSDFVLRLDFKYEAGNSGVQVRSDDQGNHQVFGYQVEVAAQKVMGLWHHSLLAKDDPARKARHLMATAGQEVTISADGKKTVKQVAAKEEIVTHYRQKGWNTMEIIAKGNTLTQTINGVVFSKVTDDDRRMSRRKGVIALQDHGKGCQVAFRNIRLKELNGE